jgi:hypothetical protein
MVVRATVVQQDMYVNGNVRDGRPTDFETDGTKADTLALPRSTSAAMGRNKFRTFMGRIN